MKENQKIKDISTTRTDQDLEDKIAELSVLYEIANLSFEGSLEDFAEEAMKKARRLFAIHGFALLKGKNGERTTVACERFWDGEDVKEKIEENKDNQFIYPLGEDGEMGIIFMEQKEKIDFSERRLYTIFGKQVEHGLALAENIRERQRAEEELREIVEGAPVGFIRLDEGFHITYVNSESEEILGVPGEKSEALGVDIRELSSVVEAGISEHFDKLPEGEEIEIETRFESIYGKETILKIRGIPLYRGDDFNGVILMFGDITERKRAEEKLRESEEKYRTVFETTGTAMVVIEEDTTISLVNEEAVDLSGYTKEEIEGNLSWAELVAGEEKLEKMKRWHKLRREDPSAAPNRYEFKLVDKKGNEKDLLISIDVVPGTKKSVASLIDITDQKQSKRQIRQSFVELAETTSRVLGVHDPYTQEHEERAAELAREVGKRMGLNEDKLLGLYLGGMLHDIGKISIPENILYKPGELTDLDWERIKSHPKVGYNQILEDTDFPWPVAEMALHHHERLDGSGYPDGLEGEELTTEVRILGAVDVVEAMSTRRPYREARSKERTLKVIRDGKGGKFDPEVVDILIDMIDEGEIEFGDK